MGKNKWIKQIDHYEDEDINPSCMWGIIHAFDFHSWHARVNKKSPRSINDKSRHITGNRFSGETLVDKHPGELEKLLDDNDSQFLVDKDTKKSGVPHKRSLRARIKALIVEEMHKQKSSKKKRKSGSSNQPKFQRTCSIHHREPSELDLSEICSDKKQINANDKYDTFNDENVSKYQFKDHTDVLEMFKANKELFLEILSDAEAGVETSKRKRLTKSGSYPAHRNLKPSKLEDKKNEVWSSAKKERLISVSRSTSLSNHAKNLFSSLGLLDEEVGVKEDKYGNKQGATYENLNGDEYNVSKCFEIDGFDISKTPNIHRRSSSLNESMERYTKLFEQSFSKEVKLNSSRSLKLTSEHDTPSAAFRRIRSLSNGVPGDAQFSEWLISTVEEKSSHVRAGSDRDEKPIYTTLETEVKANEDMKTVEETVTIIDEVTVFKGNSDTDQPMKNNTELIQSDMVQNSEIFLEEDISSCEEFQISEALVLRNNVDSLAKANHSYRKENADLCYVKDILEHSGFSRNFFQTTRYSQSQVLNPATVEELEFLWHEEDEICIDKSNFCCHHELLFDLVNEVLARIYDRSFTYYPKALSYSCHVRVLPENVVIKEVCNKVSALLRLKPEQESIDAIVDKDLSKDDIGWMNLQLESEGLSLELEDIIFNDLLDELISTVH